MFNPTKHQISELAALGQCSDMEIRSDLVLGLIRDEDDYTSNFTGTLRRNINAHARFGLNASSMRVPRRVEQRLGCDGAIVIESNGYCKIALFEAKWPRFNQKAYPWDTADFPVSHYSSQVVRQRRAINLAAVFEIFYNETKPGVTSGALQAQGSTCVWHSQADTFMASNIVGNAAWTTPDLLAMFGAGTLSVHDIVMSVCTCQNGKPIRGRALDMISEFEITGDVLIVKCAPFGDGA